MANGKLQMAKRLHHARVQLQSLSRSNCLDLAPE
jgi:hypothetical protein